MTIRKPSKAARSSVLSLLMLCLTLGAAHAQESDEAPADEAVDTAAETAAEDTAKPAPKTNPRRAASFYEATQAAGDDGISVYCYGPNWNRRSFEMLKTFWETPELEAATGSAILLAMPYYENPTPEQQDKMQSIGGNMQKPAFGVCPTVMLFDSTGNLYASLSGLDNLGTEDNEFKTGYDNLRKHLEMFRKLKELMQKAEAMPNGVEKAKILGEVADLPIKQPRGLMEMIREADPDDASGMVRRNSFAPLAFLYEQMETSDGFLSPDFIEDYDRTEKACLKIAKDETLRPLDRQAAYLLLIGASRRNNVQPIKIKNLVNACAKIDPKSKYGVLSTHLIEKWANNKNAPSAEDRRNKRKNDREMKKERNAREKEEKHNSRHNEVR